MDDYDFMSEIGIDPGSIDYSNTGSALSNEGLWDQMQGSDWTPEGWEQEFGGNDGIYDTGDQNLGALSQSQEAEPLGTERTDSDLAAMDKLAKVASKADMRNDLQKIFNLKADSEGSTDWLNPKNIDKLVKLGLGLGNLLGSRKQSAAAANPAQQTAALQQQLQQQLRNAWTPQQAQWANQFFQTPINPARGVQQASDMRSPIVPGRGYADGGRVSRGFGGYGDPAAAEEEVVRSMPVRIEENIFDRTRRRHAEDAGLMERPTTLQRGTERSLPTKMLPITDLLRSLPQLFKSLGFSDGEPAQAYPPGYAEGGGVGALTATAPFVGYVEGDTPGQADLIDAKLAAGEYVFDADTVAALGDGNNAAGAKALDRMREDIRGMKRGAPNGEIPPALHGDGE